MFKQKKSNFVMCLSVDILDRCCWFYLTTATVAARVKICIYFCIESDPYGLFLDLLKLLNNLLVIVY